VGNGQLSQEGDIIFRSLIDPFFYSVLEEDPGAFQRTAWLDGALNISGLRRSKRFVQCPSIISKCILWYEENTYTNGTGTHNASIPHFTDGERDTLAWFPDTFWQEKTSEQNARQKQACVYVLREQESTRHKFFSFPSPASTSSCLQSISPSIFSNSNFLLPHCLST
jgi:hypothetical protein